MMFITGDRQLVLLMRKPRSKWYVIACSGPRRHFRSDGTCKHVDSVMTTIKPEIRARVRVEGYVGRKQ